MRCAATLSVQMTAAGRPEIGPGDGEQRRREQGDLRGFIDVTIGAEIAREDKHGRGNRMGRGRRRSVCSTHVRRL